MKWRAWWWVAGLILGAVALVLIWPVERERALGEERRPVSAPGDTPPGLRGRGLRPVPAALVAEFPQPPDMPPDMLRLEESVFKDSRAPWEIRGIVRNAATGEPVGTALRLLNVVSPIGRRRLGLRSTVQEVAVGGDGTFRHTIDPALLPAPFFLSGARAWLVVAGQYAGARPAPGDDRPFVVTVVRAFYVEGRVVNKEGEALAANIGYPLSLEPGECSAPGFFSGACTGEDGRFVVGPLPVDRAQWPTARCGPCPESLTVSASEYVATRFDPWSLSPGERAELVVTLDGGVAVSGIVVDTSGHPLAGMHVLAQDSEASWHWPAYTDESGVFRLQHVPDRSVTIRAWDFTADIGGRVKIRVRAARDDLRLVVRPIELSAVPQVYWICGLGLVEVDEEMREQYGVVSDAEVMVYDPGSVATLKRGHGITGANFEPVRSIKGILRRLLAKQRGPFGPTLSISYRDPSSVGLITHCLEIGERDRTALSWLLDSMR